MYREMYIILKKIPFGKGIKLNSLKKKVFLSLRASRYNFILNDALKRGYVYTSRNLPIDKSFIYLSGDGQDALQEYHRNEAASRKATISNVIAILSLAVAIAAFILSFLQYRS